MDQQRERLRFCFGAIQRRRLPRHIVRRGGKVITPLGPTEDQARSLIIQSDGKIVLAGSSHDWTNSDFALVRYNGDGSLDASFGDGGKVVTSLGFGWDEPYGVAIQSDGKIVVTGSSERDMDYGPNRGEFALVRYNPDGSLDASFGDGGMVTTAQGDWMSAGLDIAIQPDGKIVVAGRSEGDGSFDFTLIRYLAEDQTEAPVSFVDGDLEAAVEAVLGVTDPTPSQMLELRVLNASYSYIYDLTGLEHARDLTQLSLDRNNIRDLTPLSNLKNLSVLHLYENAISDVTPLLGMKDLDRLDLRANPLNQEAYATDIPQIEENNGGARVTYDPAGQIAGWKWNDQNRNGVWDPGEPGLSGRTIYLDQDLDGRPG